jgi:hypothetical protein
MKSWVSAVYRGVSWPYAVSEEGDVMSVVPAKGRRVGTCLRPGANGRKGHLGVSLNHAGRVQTALVHRLVVESFYGPIPAGMEVNHIDFDPTNNRLTNLEIVTPLENVRHTQRAGRTPHGSGHYGAKLTEADIPTIRELARDGILQREIATRFGIDRKMVSCIVNRKNWKHVL